MGVATRIRDQYLEWLDELITAGESIPMEQRAQLTSMNVLTKEKRYRHYNVATWSQFVAWRTSCIAVLDQIVARESLLRRTVDEISGLGNKASDVEFLIGFLRSVQTELERGSLEDMVLRVEAEVLSDYLEQASSILGDSGEPATHLPAAVLAGASLERSLRSICEALDPREPVVSESGKPFAMNALIDSLKKRKVFNEVLAKQLRAWAAIRNSAAHGNFEDFDRQQVEQMVKGVQTFVSRHMT